MCARILFWLFVVMKALSATYGCQSAFVFRSTPPIFSAQWQQLYKTPPRQGMLQQHYRLGPQLLQQLQQQRPPGVLQQHYRLGILGFLSTAHAASAQRSAIVKLLIARHLKC